MTKYESKLWGWCATVGIAVVPGMEVKDISSIAAQRGLEMPKQECDGPCKIEVPELNYAEMKAVYKEKFGKNPKVGLKKDELAELIK